NRHKLPGRRWFGPGRARAAEARRPHVPGSAAAMEQGRPDPPSRGHTGEPVCSTLGRRCLGGPAVSQRSSVFQTGAGYTNTLHAELFSRTPAAEQPAEATSGPADAPQKPGTVRMTVGQRAQKVTAVPHPFGADGATPCVEIDRELAPPVPSEPPLSAAVAFVLASGKPGPFELGDPVGSTQDTSCLLGSWSASLNNSGIGGDVCVSWDIVDVEGALLVCNLQITDSKGGSVTLAMPLRHVLQPRLDKQCNWGCLVDSLGEDGSGFPFFFGRDRLAVPSTLLAGFGSEAISAVWRLWNSGQDQPVWTVFAQGDSLLVISAEVPTPQSEFERAARTLLDLPAVALLEAVSGDDLICHQVAELQPQKGTPRVLRLSGVAHLDGANGIYVEDCLRQGAHLSLSAVYEEESMPVLYSLVAPESTNPLWRVVRRNSGESKMQPSVVAKWTASGWMEAKKLGKKKHELFLAKTIALEELGPGGWHEYRSPGASVSLTNARAQEVVEQLTRKKGLRVRSQGAALKASSAEGGVGAPEKEAQARSARAPSAGAAGRARRSRAGGAETAGQRGEAERPGAPP
ncbi:unnamed protein product, partial [Prorocentrum cordatum]